MSNHLPEDDEIIIDFEALPDPDVIEEISYDAILQNMKEKFEALAPEYAHLYAADPITKVFQTFAYREFYLRQRINSSMRAYMLPFSAEADLDMLGAFYGVERNVLEEAESEQEEDVLESDSSFRARIRDRIRGWSTAGPVYHYQFWAREGIGGVQDVRVYSPEGGLVRISILSVDDDGVPSEDLLDEVSEQVGRDDVRMLTDTVEVVPAVKVTLDVNAVIYLREDTPFRVFEELVDNFETSFKNAVRLGRDVTRPYLTDLLFAEGVYSVELEEPVSDLILGNDEFPALGAITLEYGGRRE